MTPSHDDCERALIAALAGRYAPVLGCSPGPGAGTFRTEEQATIWAIVESCFELGHQATDARIIHVAGTMRGSSTVRVASELRRLRKLVA